MDDEKQAPAEDEATSPGDTDDPTDPDANVGGADGEGAEVGGG